MSTPLKIVKIDPTAGMVGGPTDGTPGVLDGLALAAQELLAMREVFAEVANVGDWLIGRFDGMSPALIQLFPNGERLKTRAQVQASAENLMGWLGGKWDVVNHTSRVSKVDFAGVRQSVVVLHYVDGVATEIAVKEGTDHA